MVSVPKSIFWNFCETLSRRGLSTATTLILAYILTPSEFGLMAIVMVCVTVGCALMESGLKDALIRTSNPKQESYDTVFLATLMLSVVACLLLIVAAPHIAGYFGEQELSALVRVAAIGIVFNALQIVPIAILHQNLQFKTLFRVSVPANVISSTTAVVLALVGAGVWSMVVQMLLSASLTALFLWRLRLWKPSTDFCCVAFKRFFHFGAPLLLSGLLQTIFANAYVFVFAKLFATSVAGLYFFAEKIRDVLVLQLVTAIQTVTYPALSALKSDELRLKAGFRRLILIATFVVFPVILLSAALAEPMFKVFLPERWWSAASYFQLLCVAGVVYPLHAINLNILKVMGRSDIFLYLEIAKILLTIGVLAISLRFGIDGILVGLVICSAIAYIPNSYFAKRLIGYSSMEQLKDFLPTLMLSIAVAICAYLATLALNLPDLMKLLVIGLVAPLLYLSVAAVLNLPGYLCMIDILSAKRVE